MLARMQSQSLQWARRAPALGTLCRVRAFLRSGSNQATKARTVNTHLGFYLERAAQARAEADAATLENVRDRCLRSATAWTEMAERLQRTEQLRFENEAVKAAQMAE